MIGVSVGKQHTINGLFSYHIQYYIRISTIYQPDTVASFFGENISTGIKELVRDEVYRQHYLLNTILYQNQIVIRQEKNLFKFKEILLINILLLDFHHLNILFDAYF